ncbi:MAG: hypothetical protein JWM86_2298 [Thermoleophilia bacterium]|nr:hypothetical protein [Thermoleophilia bacterium]
MYHEQLARVNTDLAVLTRESARTTRMLEQAMLDLDEAAAEVDSLRTRLRIAEERMALCPNCSGDGQGGTT